MILSVSRRTDIPNYYANWFCNRLREGFLYVRNPFNARRISKIELSPAVIDCIVFWTKNPERLMEKMDELKDYPCYFQFTLTGYGRETEPGLPDKKRLLCVFQRLSKEIGKDRVIWRYDPILFNDTYTPRYHVRAFREIADCLEGYTERAVISFLDFYEKTKQNTRELNLRKPEEGEMRELAQNMAELAAGRKMSVESCAEALDLQSCGVKPGACIDRELIEGLIGCGLKGNKDHNQRDACGCLESVDVGAYHTCKSGCRYCYANGKRERVLENAKRYDVNSPLLCGTVGPEDVVTERKMKSLRESQLSLFFH